MEAVRDVAVQQEHTVDVSIDDRFDYLIGIDFLLWVVGESPVRLLAGFLRASVRANVPGVLLSVVSSASMEVDDDQVILGLVLELLLKVLVQYVRLGPWWEADTVNLVVEVFREQPVNVFVVLVMLGAMGEIAGLLLAAADVKDVDVSTLVRLKVLFGHLVLRRWCVCCC